MSQPERYKRFRLLVKQLNRQRKQQAKQIDILCNDFIGAQRSFIDRLQDIGFATEFYRSLLGGMDLDSLLARAGRVIRQELPGAGVAFFLRHADHCEWGAVPEDEALCREPPGPGSQVRNSALGVPPQEYLDLELAENICKRNGPCTLEDLMDLGGQGDWEALNRFALVTLPLSDLGRPVGFVLLYCLRPQVLTVPEVRRISPALQGLAQAIRAVSVAGPQTRKEHV